MYLSSIYLSIMYFPPAPCFVDVYIFVFPSIFNNLGEGQMAYSHNIGRMYVYKHHDIVEKRKETCKLQIFFLHFKIYSQS